MLHLDSVVEPSFSNHVASRPACGSRVAYDGLEGPLSMGTLKLLKAREHVFTAGDSRTHVYKIESGAVCLYKIMPDGRRQVIDFAYPGDFIGLGSEAEYTVNGQALEPTRLKCVPVATLSRMAAADPALGMKLYEAISRELAATQDHLFTIGQRSAAERVACFLLALSRRNARRGQDATTVVLPMTRSDIADFLGLTIETVSRTLTKLRAASLIDLKQCTLVRLLDIVQLERLAGGEASV